MGKIEINFDVDKLMVDVAAAVKGAVGDDIDTMSDFSKDQLKKLAEQAKMIAEGKINGELTDDDVAYYTKSLKEMTSNYVETLKGLSVIAAQQAWNAAVGAIKTAIETALGQAFPWL